jgi:hypothetical protein
MTGVGSRWAVLAAFGLAWPLACGGHSRTTPGDPDPSEAGKGSGGSSSQAGTKATPAGGSPEPGAGGGAPAFAAFHAQMVHITVTNVTAK